MCVCVCVCVCACVREHAYEVHVCKTACLFVTVMLPPIKFCCKVEAHNHAHIYQIWLFHVKAMDYGR